MKHLAFFLVLFSSSAISACGGEAAAPVVSQLQLNMQMLRIGEIGQGTFVVTDSDGTLGGSKIKIVQTHEGGTSAPAEAPLQGAIDGLTTPLNAAFAYGLAGAAPSGQWTVSLEVIEEDGTTSNKVSATITMTQ